MAEEFGSSRVPCKETERSPDIGVCAIIRLHDSQRTWFAPTRFAASSPFRHSTLPVTAPTPETSFHDLPWPQRLDFIVEMMREMSTNTDPQVMVQAYIARMRRMVPSDRWMAVSRRDL